MLPANRPVPGTPTVPLPIGGNPTRFAGPVLAEHLEDTTNPHHVTAAQAGAIAAPTGGTTGQFLQKTGEGTQWASVDMSSKLTAPSGNGTNGQVLTTNGNGGVSWTTPVTAYSSLTGKPSINGHELASGANTLQTLGIAAASHAHALSDVTGLSSALSGKESSTNRVGTLTGLSTDTEYPSAKCVYDALSAKIPVPQSNDSSKNGMYLKKTNDGTEWSAVSGSATITINNHNLVDGNNTLASLGIQAALNPGQLAAVGSGITSALVGKITANETAIAGKQNTLDNGQLAAVNSGITSADVAKITANETSIAGKITEPTGGTAGQFLKKTNSGTEWATVNVSPSSTLNSNSTIEIPSSKAVADWVNAETAVPGLLLSAWTTTGLSDGETIEEGPSREGRVWLLTTSVGIYICNASSSANTLDWDPYDDATEAAGATPVSAREVFRSTRGFEKYSNKVTSLNSSSSDEQYPSAKCVYDKLALKLESSDIANRQLTSSRVTSLSSDSADHQYPSAKCVYDALALKEDTANKATGISSSSTDTQYPSAKCVYDSINSAKPYAVNTLASGSAGSSNTLQLVAGAVNVLTMSQAADYTLILPQVASGTQEDLLLEITIVMGLGSMGSLSVVTPSGVTMSRFKLTSDVQLAIPPSGVLYNVYLMSYIIRAESSTSYRVFTSHRKAVSA